MAIDWGIVTGTVGMVTGVGALWLGILNRRHAKQQTATRVRVEAILKGEEAPTHRRFLVRVVNDSAFAVRIDSVGLELRDPEGSQQHTVQLIELDGDRSSRPRPQGLSLDASTSDLPVEVAARASIVMRLDRRETIALASMPFEQAFAITATGERFVSDSRSPMIGKTLVQMRGGGQ